MSSSVGNGDDQGGPVRNPLTWLLVTLVRGYQLIVSPWIAPRCKYYPSCSTYAVTALRMHGPVRGAALAAWRVLRCNPWSLGGVDHVPPRHDAARPDDADAVAPGPVEPVSGGWRAASSD